MNHLVKLALEICSDWSYHKPQLFVIAELDPPSSGNTCRHPDRAGNWPIGIMTIRTKVTRTTIIQRTHDAWVEFINCPSQVGRQSGGWSLDQCDYIHSFILTLTAHTFFKIPYTSYRCHQLCVALNQNMGREMSQSSKECDVQYIREQIGLSLINTRFRHRPYRSFVSSREEGTHCPM